MNGLNNVTSKTGRIRTFIRENISPRLSHFYASKWGFAHRTELANKIKELNINNFELLKDQLLAYGILKKRFYGKINSPEELHECMLSGTITRKQLEAVEESINTIINSQKIGEILNSLQNAEEVVSHAQAILSKKSFNAEEFFKKTSRSLADLLDRVFPNSNGIHSKLFAAILSIYDFSDIHTKSGSYRIGFFGALALGTLAIVASPFLLPTIGYGLTNLGASVALVVKLVSAAFTALGLVGRIAKRYIHSESRWIENWATQKLIEHSGWLFRAGLTSLFLSFTFGPGVTNTWSLGKWLLDHQTLLGWLSVGIPAVAIGGSAAYYFFGTRHAIRANEGIPPPYGEKETQIRDIKKTYLYSGSAVAFSTTYFLYRLLATSMFVSAAFSPISLTSVLLTMSSTLGGYLLGHLLPYAYKNFRSPWFSFISGTAVSVLLPMLTGSLIGDYGSFEHTLSAIISLGVFAQDIHTASHGITFHQGQIASLFPDRLAPNLDFGTKKRLAGIFGRPEKAITSFWEKAHVNPPDVVFSALTSALYEPSATLKQCLLQCDAANRGRGGRAGDVYRIVRITNKSQEVLDELYQKCRKYLDDYRNRKNQQNLEKEYQELINLLLHLGRYFVENIPETIKKMQEEFEQEWKGIYDASADIAIKKGAEFFAQAAEIERRLKNNDQLTSEEVEKTLIYLCDRFDKEFVLGIRKDSNEYVMRIQKNENQSGLREFIGNTAYEIVRFNSQTGQASIDRILATHIRRQDLSWQHTGNGREDKYKWYHRTDPTLASDPEAVKELRAQVRSHSKDLAFVINNNKGNPLALQTVDGQILLVKKPIQPLTIKLSDGTDITICLDSAGNLQAQDRTGRTYAAKTIQEYNRSTENKIYFIAAPNASIQIDSPPAEMHEYYKSPNKRPLYIYAIDPHDYEFNLDSEFVNGRIAFEYIPQFEADRKNKYAAIRYEFEREVSLDYQPSGIPKNSKPTRIEINWAPMYLRVKTKNEKEYIIPYLEEKNGQIEPTVTVEKNNINWETFLRKYAPYVTSLRLSGDKKTVVVTVKHEYQVKNGINEIMLTLPVDPFNVNGRIILPTPDPPKQPQLVRIIREYLIANPEKGTLAEIKHARRYNWRRIKRVVIENGEIYFVFDTEGKTEETEIWRHQANANVYSIHLPPLDDIKSIEVEPFKKSVGTLPYARYIYHFKTLEEAEEKGFAKVKRDGSNKPLLDPYDPTRYQMESGPPIWRVLNEKGEVIGYEFERFGRPESIFELGAFDPRSVDSNSVRIENNKLVFKVKEHATKLYPIEPGLLDLGPEENPNYEIVGVMTKEKTREYFGSSSILWINANQWFRLKKKIKNAASIIEVKYNQGKIEIIKKEKYAELLLTNPALAQMNYSAEWVEKVEFGKWTEQGREIKIYYKNPFTEKTINPNNPQTIYLLDPKLESVDNYHQPTIELREIYDRDGNCHPTPYLKVTRVEKEIVEIDEKTKSILDQNPNAVLRVLTPKSALKLKRKKYGQEIILPLNDEIDGEKYLATDGFHFEDGKVGLIIGPQLSISGRNWFDYSRSGFPYCALDQSIFMAYDLSFGYNYGRQPYAYGIGGGNIQPHKSRAGDGRIREGTTVQNGTPVGRPMRKALKSAEAWNETEQRVPFFSLAPWPATITEDYREGKGIYKKHGHAAIFNNKVVAIGAGVEDLSQILTQRRRWPTSVPIGQYWFFRDLLDEVIYSKILRQYPSFYTWDQLLHEWNGVTWYYCGFAEYARSFAPLAYHLGYIAYPVDPISFPLIWLGQFASSMASHIYTMKKVGNHPLESLYWGQVAFKTLVPNYVEMILPQPGAPKTQGRRILEELATCRLAKECLGQFGVTALSGGGKLDERYLRKILDDISLKGAATLRGLLAMGDVTQQFVLMGSFAPDFFLPQFTTYFAIAMNTIWPYYDMLLNIGGYRLAKNDRREEPSLVNKTRAFLIAQLITKRISKNKMQYTLGITDRPEGKELGRYLQDLSAKEIKEVARYIPEFSSLIKNLLDKQYLIPAKVATIIEEMLSQRINDRIEALYRSYLNQRRGNLSNLLQQAQNDAYFETFFSFVQAIAILNQLDQNQRKQVIKNCNQATKNALKNLGIK